MCRFKCDLFLILGLLFACFSLSVCLYEDQIGKFDWKRNLVGNLKFSHFDSPTSSVKKIFVATHENVVAALGLKSGEILWRQVLEKSDAGRIQFLGLDTSVVTVSGQDQVLVRSWDPSGGFLISEWTLNSGVAEPEKQDVMWFMTSGQLFRVVVDAPTRLDVASYNINTGSKITSKQIPVFWLSGIAGCKLVAPYLACLVTKDDVSLYTINLSSQEGEIQSKPVSALFPNAASLSSLSLEVVVGSMPAVAIVAGDMKQVVVVKNTGPEAVGEHVLAENMLITASLDKDNVLLQAALVDNWIVLSGSSVETGKQLVELASRVEYPSTLGVPALTSAVCIARKDRGTGCRAVISTDDHAIALLHYPGKLAWIREEGLATITAVEMLDLPLSDADSAIEKEFDHQDSGFVGMFVHRVTSQLLQACSVLGHVLGVGPPPSPAERSGLVRDEFSLHKMIVAASRAGKLYGINNRNGEVMWQRRLGDVEAFGDGKMVMFVQRSTRHYPHAAQCALLVKHKTTGEGVLHVFNPFNGAGIGPGDGVVPLGYRVKQTLLLHQPDRDFLRSILLLDHSDSLHVYPPSGREAVAAVAADTFMFAADAAAGTLVGYSLAFSDERRLVAARVWEVKLTQGSQVITAVVSKNPVEKVHSQGRVLGDRSVLYKYNNPNLVAVVTQGNDPVHKYFLNIYLVDVVSGAVVFSVSHKKAREPIYVVHSENWLVYSYFSEKSRRTEVASLELYEGKTQSNTTAFSSVHAPLLQPIVDRQAYIMPSPVEAMRETVTEKGITSKHVIVVLANGGVLELPWAFVDPRRPFTVTQEMREEGVIPYMPELPVLTDHIVNYNQSVHRVRGIHTAPSGLESTCLVLVYGLDMFYTRVAPSKQFDVLKEDFDHILISAVLLALVVASYATKKLASKKALKQAWK